MNFKDTWRKYKDWIYVFIVLGIVTVYTYWYLSLSPQHIPSFLVAPVVAIIFVALLALMPETRRRLVNGMLTYLTRQKEMGRRLYRYQRIALVLFFIVILTFPLLLQYQFIPSQYIAWAVLTFFILVSALGAIQIAGLIKAAGWWGLLLIAIITAIVVLRFLIGRWLR